MWVRTPFRVVTRIGLPTALVDGRVEFADQLVVAALVREQCLDILELPLEFHEDGSVAAPRREACGLPLQRLADLEQLGHVVDRNRRHDEAATRMLGDKSIGAQTRERFTQRGA